MDEAETRATLAGIAHEAGGGTVRLRPVTEPDLAMLRRFATEPGLIGLDWAGYRDPGAPARRAGAADPGRHPR